ncbi:DUF485 domain-containing protein [Corynebacterium mastitidis]|uniref:DUF485 domain-containing protein n=1 Tax=Corynebacterium mastitidis TaxID=161890 RepID=A0A2N0X7B0_9CORY|nr:DUF485 domain-containing protein [Corynebacterium mastitidis]MCH6197625.1 DUF485 domain-containing protein [Corynebacterium mastitidis]PKF68595.1 DUF485 domain-containing protein [Corynebacterium mastitidis]
MTTTTPGAAPHTPTSEEFRQAHGSAEFAELRSTIRSFAFPVTALGLAWFGLYIALAMYAPGLYGTPVAGNINLGIVLGLLQFLSTFAITWAYVRYADRNIEPRSSALRERLENPHA